MGNSSITQAVARLRMGATVQCAPGTVLYHATPASNVPGIMAHGLRPEAHGAGGTNLPGVYTGENREAVAGFVQMLYVGQPIAVLAIAAEGLHVGPGDDDDDIVAYEAIPASRITRLA